ncbi:hypothetical protein [Pararhodobacter zhoushanensis]|uniref:RDD family protein n=1 Tax=Pararhodobacter zhoushanensis TaxID=2479545 RepID=A0ABT3H1E9_9RHOB|nr:hypothetical protein [Pararhodobacter zhoushanensis]MCW1933609.1 hypothetical protein [Pararhodobacter zhoushanensis]
MTPPRHLARRLLALAVDALLASALAVVLLLPFSDRGLRLSTPLLALRGFDCTEVETAPDWLARALGTVPPYSLRHCAATLYGLPNGFELRMILADTRNAAPRTTRRIVVPVDAAMQPVPARLWVDILPLALLGLVSALLTARGWRTPGKRLAGLRLVPGARPRPFLREILRLGPLLALACVPLIAGDLTAPGPGAVIALAAAGALGLVWYYLWPFAAWQGLSRHDRLASYSVTR